MERLSDQNSIEPELHQQRLGALEEAAREGDLNLLIYPAKDKEPLVKIITKKGETVYMARVVYTHPSQETESLQSRLRPLYADDIEYPDSPMEMLITTPEVEEGKEEKYAQIARKIPAFIRSFCDLEISTVAIYETLREFKEKKPRAKIRFPRIVAT